MGNGLEIRVVIMTIDAFASDPIIQSVIMPYAKERVTGQVDRFIGSQISARQSRFKREETRPLKRPAFSPALEKNILASRLSTRSRHYSRAANLKTPLDKATHVVSSHNKLSAVCTKQQENHIEATNEDGRIGI